MFAKKRSYPLEILTLERTPNPEHSIATNDVDNHLSNTDVQEQITPTIFKPFVGLFYVCLHSTFNQLASVIIKMLPYINPCQLSLLRYIGFFVGALPIAVYQTGQVFGENKFRFLLIQRSFFASTALLLYVMAYHYLPLAEASIILSMYPIATAIMARIILKESFGLAQSTSLVMTVCGVLLAIRIPELLRNKKEIHFDSTYIAGLVSAFAGVLLLALSAVYTRKLRKVNVSVIVMYAGVIGAIENSFLNGVFYSFVPSECGWDQVLCFLFVIFCFVSNYFINGAIQVEPAGIAAVQKSSLDVLIIIPFQAIFFNAYPDLYVISGTCLVIASLIILGIKNWILLMPEQSNIRRKLGFLL